MSRVKKAFRGQGGFTLIELLVVIVILGVLAAIIVPAVMGLIGEGAEEAARTDLRSIQTEVMAHYVTDNEWPDQANTDTFPGSWDTIADKSGEEYENVAAYFDGTDGWWVEVQFTDDAEDWLFVNNEGVQEADAAQGGENVTF